MSWLRIDDAFEDNPKVAPLSDSAHRLWFKVACWSCKAANIHTQGFVPEVLLESIAPKFSKKKLKVLAKELVEANAGGTKEYGLWEKVDGGFQIHDWHDYRPPEEKLTKSEAASIAGKKSAEVRRQRNGTAQPGARTKARTFDRRSEDSSTEQRSPNEQANDYPNEDRTSRTPDPVPVPGSKAAGSKTRPTGQGDQSTPSVQPRPPQNLDDALKLPIMARAQALVDTPHLQQWVQPHRWPEVQRLGKAFATSTGWHAPRWSSPTQKAVMPLVRLLAEFTTEELKTAVNAAKGHEFLRDKGFSTLTDEVVRRLLPANTSNDDEEVQRRDEDREKRDAARKERARQNLLPRKAS